MSSRLKMYIQHAWIKFDLILVSVCSRRENRAVCLGPIMRVTFSVCDKCLRRDVYHAFVNNEITSARLTFALGA
jgi:hypothetical protein